MDGFWVCLTVRGVIEGSPELAWLRDQFPPPGKYQSACCVLSTRYNNNNTHVHTYSKQAHKCSNVCAYMHAHASNCREVSEVKPEKAFKNQKVYKSTWRRVCAYNLQAPALCAAFGLLRCLCVGGREQDDMAPVHAHRPQADEELHPERTDLQAAGWAGLTNTHTHVNVKCVLIYRHVITIHTDISATKWISAVRGALRLNFLLN